MLIWFSAVPWSQDAIWFPLRGLQCLYTIAMNLNQGPDLSQAEFEFYGSVNTLNIMPCWHVNQPIHISQITLVWVLVHILLPVNNNELPFLNRQKKENDNKNYFTIMTIEIISQSISMKVMWLSWGSNLWPLICSQMFYWLCCGAWCLSQNSLEQITLVKNTLYQQWRPKWDCAAVQLYSLTWVFTVGMYTLMWLLILIMLNKLRCHDHFWFSANEITWFGLLR